MASVNSHCTNKENEREDAVCVSLPCICVILSAADCLKYGLNLRHNRHSERQLVQEMDSL